VKNSTDVVIHINEELDDNHREGFSSDVCQCKGVLSVDMNESRPHLMIVAYDPAKTRSFDVLSCVRNQGFHAQLVGWL